MLLIKRRRPLATGDALRARSSGALRTTSVFIALLLMASLAAGCGGQEGPATPEQSEPTATPAPPDTGAADTPPVALADLRVELEPVVRGLEQPLFLTHAGDGSGRLFVVEQEGRVRVVRDGTISEGAFLDVRRDITSGGERGLLGLAFAPDYATSGIFYVNYTDRNGDTVVARYTAEDPASDTPRLSDPEAILTVEQPYANHNGGCIVFEPGTTRLWVGMGDGGSGGNPQENAQNERSLLGKMLVLDVGEQADTAATIFMTGLRNPWRFSFDRETRDVWIADVGQSAREEIDFIELTNAEGANWGWNFWEGSEPFRQGAEREGFLFPIAEYGRDKGGSITGGYVYRGDDYPAMRGAYIYGDFVAGWVGGVRRTAPDGSMLDTPEERELVGSGEVTPSSFGEDEAGELYVCDYDGSILKVTAQAE